MRLCVLARVSLSVSMVTRVMKPCGLQAVVSVESSEQSNDTPGGMASPVCPAALVSHPCAHNANAGGSIAVGVLLSGFLVPAMSRQVPCLSQLPAPLQVPCASCVRTTDPQVMQWYKIL